MVLNIGRGIENMFSMDLIRCDNSSGDMKEGNLKINWIINKLTATKLEEPFDRYCFSKSTDNTFLLMPNELDFGDYVLRIYAFNEFEPENYVRVEKIIRIGSSPIVTNLNNNAKYVELNWDQTLFLDFYRNTYDPDLRDKSDKSNINFNLFCIEGTQDEQKYWINDIRKQAQLGQFDLTVSGLNLKYQNTALRINFFEKNCILNNETNMELENQVLNIKANNLNLNTSIEKPLLMQVLVNKNSRFSLSNQVYVMLNLSSISFAVPSTDATKMAEQLEKLDNFARVNPKKALDLLGSFVNAINEISVSNSDDQQVCSSFIQSLENKIQLLSIFTDLIINYNYNHHNNYHFLK